MNINFQHFNDSFNTIIEMKKKKLMNVFQWDGMRCCDLE